MLYDRTKKVALEEHFATEEFLQDAKPWFIREGQDVWERARDAICDITEQRVELMDQAGISHSVLSMNSPALQAMLDTEAAKDASVRLNDYTAEKIANHRDRFDSFACLATQDPDFATAELERCVKDYGFKGALINGFCQIDDPSKPIYLDDPRYLDFWAKAEELEVPIYLHPRPTIDAVREAEFGNQKGWLATAAWGWHCQTGTHLLRLIGSGLFDKYPNLTVLVGHMGELIPFFLWRTTNRVTSHRREYAGELTPKEYFQKNIMITTSGNCSTPALMCSLMEMSTDRIMFSTDYPFDTMQQAADWFDNIPFCDLDKAKMGYQNASKLFKL